MKLRRQFSRFAKGAARYSGHPLAFALAISVVAVWGLTGPMFGYSDTWQLIINTGTTIVTFLMVFLIQNSQNRDGAAIQIKLDELIRAIDRAHNSIIDLEALSEDELELFHKTYAEVAKSARRNLKEFGLSQDCDGNVQEDKPAMAAAD